MRASRREHPRAALVAAVRPYEQTVGSSFGSGTQRDVGPFLKTIFRSFVVNFPLHAVSRIPLAMLERVKNVRQAPRPRKVGS